MTTEPYRIGDWVQFKDGQHHKGRVVRQWQHPSTEQEGYTVQITNGWATWYCLWADPARLERIEEPHFNMTRLLPVHNTNMKQASFA